jgi:hypothetical protein
MKEYFSFADYTIRRTMADQIIFLQTKSSQYYVATGVGLNICNQLDKGTSLESIVNHICETYNIDKDTAEADTTKFLQSLEAAGIIHKSIE